MGLASATSMKCFSKAGLVILAYQGWTFEAFQSFMLTNGVFTSQLECETQVLLKKKAQHKEGENLIIARSVDNRSISPSIYKICC